MFEDTLETLILTWVRRNWEIAYQETPIIVQEICRYLSAVNSLAFVLSDEKGFSDSENPLYVLSLEIEADCEASILLAISGFYRHAILALRSWLALAFQSIWFSFDKKAYDKWMKCEPTALFQRDDIMSFRCLKELMKKSVTLAKAESEFKLIDDGMKLYQDLSGYVHATGRKVLDIYHRQDSVPHFYPDHSRLWLERFMRIFKIWVILTFARYPELLDMAHHKREKDEVLCLLGSETVSKLESFRLT